MAWCFDHIPRFIHIVTRDIPSKKHFYQTKNLWFRYFRGFFDVILCF